MSIEITSNVDRHNAIFMAGESFVVSVFLRNTSDAQPSSLAWGCVQLHCDQLLLKAAPQDDSHLQHQHRHHNENGSEMRRPAGFRDKTSMARAKRAIFSSPPTIIFCDVHLKAGERLQFEHTIELPLHLPPSYKGNFVRYHWYVSVAVQHVDAPIKVLQLPVRVINMTVDVLTSMSASQKARELMFSENPFLSRDKQMPSVVEIATEKIEEVTSVRTLQTYEMKYEQGVFAVITIFKNFFKLGDEIVGRINFPTIDEATALKIHCLQVLVRLETIEVNLYGNKREEHVAYVFTEHCVTAFVREIHFKLPIPLTAVPPFSTEAVQLRWRLHFEFVTTARPPIEWPSRTLASGGGGEQFSGLAAELPIETMSWDVYVSVHSCNPHNVALVCNVPSSSVSLIV